MRGLSERRISRMRGLLREGDDSHPGPEDVPPEEEDAFKQSMQERDYPEADPGALKLRALIGSDIGPKLLDAMNMAHDAASTEQDSKKKARYMRMAETLRQAQNLLGKKVWQDLQPLLDPSFL